MSNTGGPTGSQPGPTDCPGQLVSHGLVLPWAQHRGTPVLPWPEGAPRTEPQPRTGRLQAPTSQLPARPRAPQVSVSSGRGQRPSDAARPQPQAPLGRNPREARGCGLQGGLWPPPPERALEGARGPCLFGFSLKLPKVFILSVRTTNSPENFPDQPFPPPAATLCAVPGLAGTHSHNSLEVSPRKAPGGLIGQPAGPGCRDLQTCKAQPPGGEGWRETPAHPWGGRTPGQ